MQALILLGALACAIYLFICRPDRYWYGGRAVAESIKTVTWRFVSKAEPFINSDEIDRSQFTQKLRAIVEQNIDVAQHMVINLELVQITDNMIAFRQKAVEERRSRYVNHRIVDQQNGMEKSTG